MAYDAALADRVRQLLKGQRGLTEKEMFGGIAFLIRGNMACGVRRDEMMVRIDPDDEAVATEPHVRPFDLSHRPMKGWVLVGPAGLKRAADLKRWVGRGKAFALSLPPK